MGTQCKTVLLVALVAIAVGAAAGWFAAGARGKNKCNTMGWQLG